MTSVNPGPATTTTPNTTAGYAPVNTGNKPVELLTNARRLLAVARGVNVNATGDTQIMPVVNAGVYAIEQVVFTNASISLTTAAAGIFTAANAGGTSVVANAALSALTGPTVVNKPTVVAATLLLALTAQNLYLNVGTAQGAAATMDVFIYGYDLT